MNVRVKKLFKIIFWLLISLIVFSYIALQATYYLALKDVKHLLVPSQNIYSETIKDVTWVAYRGRGEIEIVKNTPLSYMMKFFLVAYNVSGNSYDLLDGVDSSATLVSHDARMLIGFGKKLKWHALSGVSASIWISQNFSEDEAIATILDKGYFAHGLHSISEVAYFHFDKKVENLSLDEIVFILTMQRAPSYYNPITKPERHEKGAQHLQKQLNKHWPEKYAGYVYKRPELVERSEVEKILKNTEIPYQHLLFSEVMLKYLSHSVKSN